MQRSLRYAIVAKWAARGAAGEATAPVCRNDSRGAVAAVNGLPACVHRGHPGE